MKELKCTIEDVLSWRPCSEYTEESIKKLFGRKKYLTAIQILNIENISIEHRFWAVLRPKLIDEKILHNFACNVAEWALNNERKAGREPDPRSWTVIDAKRKWLKSEITDAELKKAYEAAWYVAAQSAACVVAWVATQSARVAWVVTQSTAQSTVQKEVWNTFHQMLLDLL